MFNKVQTVNSLFDEHAEGSRDAFVWNLGRF